MCGEWEKIKINVAVYALQLLPSNGITIIFVFFFHMLCLNNFYFNIIFFQTLLKICLWFLIHSVEHTHTHTAHCVTACIWYLLCFSNFFFYFKYSFIQIRIFCCRLLLLHIEWTYSIKLRSKEISCRLCECVWMNRWTHDCSAYDFENNKKEKKNNLNWLSIL